MTDIAIIQKEKLQVQDNIRNLEAQINALNAQLQQANANLLASRGAVLGFDRLLEIFAAPPAKQEPTPEDVAALENGK
jgi:hypothetical protein